VTDEKAVNAAIAEITKEMGIHSSKEELRQGVGVKWKICKALPFSWLRVLPTS